MPSSSEQAEPPEPSVREATDGFEATNPGHAPKLLETRPSSNMISNAREGANRQRSRESPRNANGETSVISRADKDASASLGSRALQVSGHPHINSMSDNLVPPSPTHTARGTSTSIPNDANISVRSNASFAQISPVAEFYTTPRGSLQPTPPASSCGANPRASSSPALTGIGTPVTNLSRPSSATGHGRGHAEEHEPARKKPRSGYEAPNSANTGTLGAMEPVIALADAMRRACIELDRRIQDCNGCKSFDGQVDKPRYRILRDACAKGDIFYVIIHRFFCLWSRDKTLAHKAFATGPECIDSTFNQLMYVLRSNNDMSPAHLAWFSGFPHFLHRVEGFSSACTDVAHFLAHFSTNWQQLVDSVKARGFPLLSWEPKKILMCRSPGLESILFTLSRRRAGIDDGALANSLTILFNRDQAKELQMVAVSASQEAVDKSREELARHYIELISQQRRSKTPQVPLPPSTTATTIPHRPQHPREETAFDAHGDRHPQPQYPSQHQLQQTGDIRLLPNQLHPSQLRVDHNLAVGNSIDGRHIIPSNGSPADLGHTRPHPSPFQNAPAFSPGILYSQGQLPLQAIQGPTQIAPHPGWFQHGPPPSPVNWANSQAWGVANQPAAYPQPNYAHYHTHPIRPPHPNESHPSSRPGPANIHEPILQTAPLSNDVTFSNSPRAGSHEQVNNALTSQQSTTMPPLRPRLLQTATSLAQPTQMQFTTHAIHENLYPTNAYDWTSVQSSLHLVRLRSPERAPLKPESARYYQFFESFAVEPKAFPPQKGLRTLHFTITEEILSRISKTTESANLPVCRYYNNSLRYRLRLCQYGQDQTVVSEATWATSRGFWPENIHISLNEQPKLLRRRRHFHHDLPIELTDTLVLGTNKISVSLPNIPGNIKPASMFFIAVEVINTLRHDSIWAMVENGPHISMCDTKREIQSRLKPQDSDDVIVENDSLSVTVADPFSSSLYEVPVRGWDCKHLECIDLKNWLETRPSKTRSRASEPTLVDVWTCPLCGLDARPHRLRVDEFFVDVRKRLLETGRGDTRKITITADGNWIAVEEEVVDNRDESPPAKFEAPKATPTLAPQSKSEPVIIILDDD